MLSTLAYTLLKIVGSYYSFLVIFKSNKLTDSHINRYFYLRNRHETEFKWIKLLQTLFPLGFNDNIYHEGSISKMFDFNIFSLLECQKRKTRYHGIGKNGSNKRKNRANKRANITLNCLSKVLTVHLKFRPPLNITPPPAGNKWLVPNIYHEGSISKMLDFNIFSLLECQKRKTRYHGIGKNGSNKRKNRANKRANITLNCLSKVLKDHGHHSMLSFFSALPISVLRSLDTEANKFYESTNQLYDAALLTRWYTQHALRPYIDYRFMPV